MMSVGPAAPPIRQSMQAHRLAAPPSTSSSASRLPDQPPGGEDEDEDRWQQSVRPIPMPLRVLVQATAESVASTAASKSSRARPPTPPALHTTSYRSESGWAAGGAIINVLRWRLLRLAAAPSSSFASEASSASRRPDPPELLLSPHPRPLPLLNLDRLRHYDPLPAQELPPAARLLYSPFAVIGISNASDFFFFSGVERCSSRSQWASVNCWAEEAGWTRQTHLAVASFRTCREGAAARPCWRPHDSGGPEPPVVDVDSIRSFAASTAVRWSC
mmetsp:Transcript_4214/g.10268  ORF Transcript_4214/g.10268 Transcript_4214/m.10268 type:complete len:274 (+) Transcript_4214:471-1292(+)